MTYNAKIHHEQGGSVLTVQSGGSLNVEAGGTIAGAGTFAMTGAQTADGGLTSTGTIEGASVTVTAAGVFSLGPNRVWFATSSAAPSGLPVVGVPGDIFFRMNDANSAGYINTSDGVSGSVWTIFSEL